MTLELAFVLFGGLVISMGTSLWLTPLIRDFAYQRNWTDAPDGHRKIHQRPIPRVGGIAIAIAFFVGIGYFALLHWAYPAEMQAAPLPSAPLLLCALVIAFTGFWDDIFGLNFKQKFAMQGLVAGIMIWAGYTINVLPLPLSDFSIDLGWVSVPLTLLWIVGVINAVNLLDGMDGLAAGVSIIAFSSLSAAYAISGAYGHLLLVVVVVGAIAGFLVYNFNPATVFMGDTGSLFLGFMLATYSLREAGHTNPLLAFLIPIVALGLPVIDTGLALVRRFLERRPLFDPDRDHIHHRIAHRLGLSHRSTVLVLYVVSIMQGAVAFVVALLDDFHATMLLGFTSVVLYLALRHLGYLRIRDTLRKLKARRYVRPELHQVGGTLEGAPVPVGGMPVQEDSSSSASVLEAQTEA